MTRSRFSLLSDMSPRKIVKRVYAVYVLVGTVSLGLYGLRVVTVLNYDLMEHFEAI
jgi:hypothetical protein